MEPTEDHRILLRAACWQEGEAEFGAPGIDSKRPYGNSDVEGDLERLLPHLDEGQRERVHRELSAVLTTICARL